MTKRKNPAAKRISRPRPSGGSYEILFEKASAAVGTPEKSKLREIARLLRRNPDASVVVRGHTVGRGKPDYNRTLGQERADAG